MENVVFVQHRRYYQHFHVLKTTPTRTTSTPLLSYALSTRIYFRLKTQIFPSVFKNTSVHTITFSNCFFPSTRQRITDLKTVTAY